MNNLEALDQQITLAWAGSSSPWLDSLAWGATHTWVWVPLFVSLLYVLLRSLPLRTVLVVVLLAGLCVLLSDQIDSSLFKPWVRRLRPTHEPAIANLVPIVRGYRGGLYGFFSSHAANTMSLALYFSLLLRRRCITLTLFLWALLCCWTRFYLSVHYLGDLLCGTACGLLVGWGCYALYLALARATAVRHTGCAPRTRHEGGSCHPPTHCASHPAACIVHHAPYITLVFFLTLCALCLWACWA